MHEQNSIRTNGAVQGAIDAIREKPIPAGPPSAVIEAIVGLDQPKRRSNPLRIWRILQHNLAARLAIAAAVVLAVTLPATRIWRSDSASGAAFGQVLQHFRSARSARLHLRIEQKGQPAMDSTLLVLGELTRQEETNGRVTISDTTAGKCLILTPGEGKAVLTTLTRTDDANADQPGGPLDLIERLAALQEGAEVSLGSQMIDGETAVGFHVNKDGVQWTIWADAKSRLPLRTEYHLPLFEATAIMTNFEFDVDLDPGLFSLVPPDGYALEERTADVVWAATEPEGKTGEGPIGVGIDFFSTPREEDLLEYLRLSAEQTGGVFTGDFLRAPVQDATVVMKDEHADAQARAEATNVLLKNTRAQMYLMKIQAEAERGQIASVGDGVSLGDTTQPVLMWKPAGTGKFRVVFGDLSIRDLNAEEGKRLFALSEERRHQREREQGYLGLELKMRGNAPKLLGRLNRPDEPPVIELAPGNEVCVIDRVIQGSPAEQVGLQNGDVLVSLDGQAIPGKSQFVRAVKKHKPGDNVTLVIRRGEREMSLAVTLGQRPE